MLLTAACKADKPAADKAATPVEKPASNSGSIRERPQLPRNDIPETKDWTDPEVHEQMEERRAEREKKMMERLDTNKDGVLSAEEKMQRVRPLFDRLDENQDGKLTPDELSKSDRRMPFDDPSALDTDKNGEISMQELDAAVTARRQQMREKWRGGRAPQVPAAGSDE